MNLRVLWAATVAFSVIVPRLPGVWAQSNDVVSCPAGWEWNENSLQQDPCLIASLLDATCRSISDYGIPPLQSGQSYAPPSSNNPNDLVCDCDTVMYSLYMACSACQGGSTFSWTRWITQCNSISISQYPHDIPHGTAIPRWALYNVTTLPNQTYNNDLAMTIGRDPEEMPKALSTILYSSNKGSSMRPSPSSLPSATSRDPVSSPAPSPTIGGSGKNKTGVIVGAVIGSLVPLIILSIIAAYFFGRRNRREAPKETSYQGGLGSPTLTGTSNPYSINGHGQQRRVSGYGYTAEI